MTFDALAAIKDASRVHPEPLSCPEGLEDASPIELAEARSKLNQVVQIARELGKLIDVELAEALEDSAMEYGGSIYRPANGRGSARVKDPIQWWALVHQGLTNLDQVRGQKLLDALYPASAVRLTALPKLAAAIGEEVEHLKEWQIAYDPPSSVLSVMPVAKSPKFLQDLTEGEIRKIK